MLSDNNHGSTRTLPSPEMRSHPGGYGMYYHMDMHGGPHSFEWVGATYLASVGGDDRRLRIRRAGDLGNEHR